MTINLELLIAIVGILVGIFFFVSIISGLREDQKEREYWRKEFDKKNSNKELPNS